MHIWKLTALSLPWLLTLRSGTVGLVVAQWASRTGYYCGSHAAPGVVGRQSRPSSSGKLVSLHMNEYCF
jgi:hypothetical protein